MITSAFHPLRCGIRLPPLPSPRNTCPPASLSLLHPVVSRHPHSRNRLHFGVVSAPESSPLSESSPLRSRLRSESSPSPIRNRLRPRAVSAAEVVSAPEVVSALGLVSAPGAALCHRSIRRPVGATSALVARSMLPRAVRRLPLPHVRTAGSVGSVAADGQVRERRRRRRHGNDVLCRQRRSSAGAAV